MDQVAPAAMGLDDDGAGAAAIAQLASRLNWRGVEDANFERLFLSLNGLWRGRPSYVVQFAGCRDGEGATTLAAGYARVAAQRHERPVLLVHCRPSGASAKVLTAGRVEAFDDGSRGRRPFVAEAGDGQSVAMSLHVLTAGRIGDQMSFLGRCREMFSAIVIDCPSILGTQSAALALAHFCDGTVLAVDARRGRRDDVTAVCEALHKAGGMPVAAVLNRARVVDSWLLRLFGGPAR